ncbi:MAG: DNA repair protein RadA [Parvularculales bacterium]
MGILKMARSAFYICQSCGTVSPRWKGQCDACNTWNSLTEEVPQEPGAVKKATKSISTRAPAIELGSLSGVGDPPPRLASGLGEFDRVCGGGIVPGSVLLVGGDPGIGKSTLLLQVLAHLASNNIPSVYISGEESVEQIRLRAHRLDLIHNPLPIAAETSLAAILATLESMDSGGVVVIDSIQTMWRDDIDATPGAITQLRASAQSLIRFARRHNTAVVLIGHVTKDGQIAGPRVIEHMVDSVLYFEGERSHQFRILRAVKNRYGPTDEIGVFEMSHTGLQEVQEPSALFLDDHENRVTGSAVLASIEGTRPVLVDIQALAAHGAGGGAPRRAVVGCDAGRLAMVLAVLDTRCGLKLNGHDIYLNVAGGLRVTEPAADFAMAAALISSAIAVSLPPHCALFGEISLSGALRPPAHCDIRLKEAQKLGFHHIFMPQQRGKISTPEGITIETFASLPDFFSHFSQGIALDDSVATT